MHIHLNDEDISKMPESLYRSLLDWLLKTKNLRFEQTQVIQQPKPVVSSTQLLLNLDSQKSEDKADNSHVRLSELFDAGMTKRGMAIRVKLKSKEAKKKGRDYINSMEISAEGTIFYNGEDFDQPSPLATKINGGATNGWEYVEVKKNGEWICLDQLRKIWRNSND